MRVNIFHHRDIERLQEILNEWLNDEEYGNIDVIKMLQSSHDNEFIITVLWTIEERLKNDADKIHRHARN